MAVLLNSVGIKPVFILKQSILYVAEITKADDDIEKIPSLTVRYFDYRCCRILEISGGI